MSQVSPYVHWAALFRGSSGFGGDDTNDIAIDRSGNVISVGDFQLVTDFNPLLGSANYDTLHNPNHGRPRIFICKLDSNGHYVWAKQVGNTRYQRANGVAVDDQGNIFVTGYFEGTVDFNPGNGQYLLSSDSYFEPDIFLLKLNSNGIFQWARSMGSGGDDIGFDVKVDAQGNPIVVGTFEGTVDFNPGSGTTNRTSMGQEDVFVARFTSGGNLSWVAAVGSNQKDGVWSVDISNSGKIAFCGFFSSLSNDFRSGAGNAVLPYSGDRDGFISQLNANGTFNNAWSFGNVGVDEATSVGYDQFENIYAIGSFDSIVDFRPGVQTYNLNGANGRVCILKYSSFGNLVWGKQIDAVTDINSSFPIDFRANSLDVGNNGDIFCAGFFQGAVDFDPGPGTFILDPFIGSNPAHAMYILKLSSNGNFGWAMQYKGSATHSRIKTVEVNNMGQLYVAGLLDGPTSFQPFFSVQISGATSPFLTKTIQCPPGVVPINRTSCNSYTSPSGNIYTSSGIYTETDTSYHGCIYQRQLNLIINQSDSTIDSVNSCDSYFWPAANQTYSTSGQYSATLPNKYSCDSTIQLQLEINNSSFQRDSINTCQDQYFWSSSGQFLDSSGYYQMHFYDKNGCDSIQAIDLIILEDSLVVSCDSFTWNATNTTYYSTGTLSAVVNPSVGCDSVVTLDLIINSSNSGVDSVHTCDSYFWASTGISYMHPGTYSTVLTNSAGCDSTATLELFIDNNSSTINHVSCDSFMNPVTGNYLYQSGIFFDTLLNNQGCDSIVELNLTIRNSSFSSDIIAACDSFTWINGITYFTDNNSASHILTNSDGCDSLVTLDLLVNYSSTGIDSVHACDSITWIDGITYYTYNNSASHILTNSKGCDSLVTLNLSLDYTQSYIDYQVACDSFTWQDGVTYYSDNNLAQVIYSGSNGCDSVIELDLEILYSSHYNDIIQSCDPYTWIDGIQYTHSTNAPIFVTTNSVGCDSIIHLDLTVTEIDTTMAVTGNSLTSNQVGAIYQWIDCQTGNRIPGATVRSFTPSYPGIFAVEIVFNNCIDTSECVSLLAGPDKKDLQNYRVFPNPTNNIIYVESYHRSASFDVLIYDNLGNEISKWKFEGETLHTIDVSNLSAGLYFVEIKAGDRVYKKEKIIVQD